MSTTPSQPRMSYFRALVVLGFLVASGYCFNKAGHWRRMVDGMKFHPMVDRTIDWSEGKPATLTFDMKSGIAHGMMLAFVPGVLPEGVTADDVWRTLRFHVKHTEEDYPPDVPRKVDSEEDAAWAKDLRLPWYSSLPITKRLSYQRGGNPGVYEIKLVSGPPSVRSIPLRVVAGYHVCGCEYGPLLVLWLGAFLFLFLAGVATFGFTQRPWYIPERGLASTRPNLDDNYGPLFGTGDARG